jgi:hypothetical protein
MNLHFQTSLKQNLGQKRIFYFGQIPTAGWIPIEKFYRPKEYPISEVMIYAAKAHPHLTEADLVLTLATNSFDFDKLVASDTLYYPRLLRACFKVSKER